MEALRLRALPRSVADFEAVRGRLVKTLANIDEACGLTVDGELEACTVGARRCCDIEAIYARARAESEMHRIVFDEEAVFALGPCRLDYSQRAARGPDSTTKDAGAFR